MREWRSGLVCGTGRECLIEPDGAGIGVVGVIEDVVDVGMEIETKQRSVAWNVLAEGEVELGEVGTAEIVAARVAEGSGRRGGEGRRVEVIDSRFEVRVNTRDDVGTADVAAVAAAGNVDDCCGLDDSGRDDRAGEGLSGDGGSGVADVGDVGAGDEDVDGKTAAEVDDAADLPAARDQVHRAGERVGLSMTEGKIVENEWR